MDVESLERENERGLDALSERIGLLKQVMQQPCCAGASSSHSARLAADKVSPCRLVRQQLLHCRHQGHSPVPASTHLNSS